MSGGAEDIITIVPNPRKAWHECLTKGTQGERKKILTAEGEKTSRRHSEI